MNKTGTAPKAGEVKEMLAAPFVVKETKDGMAAAKVRQQYIKDADPLGTLPPPASAKGAVKAAGKLLQGKHPNAFLDRLGERLAFERGGVRLYEALITHVQAHPGSRMPIAELRQIQKEEHDHFMVVTKAIEALGGDPTVETPAADVAGIEASGLCKVLTDPRSSPSQCLHAILVAELADNDAWQMLVDLARTLGHADMAKGFERCLTEEKEHLRKVRGWFSAAATAEIEEGQTAKV